MFLNNYDMKLLVNLQQLLLNMEWELYYNL